MTFLTGVLEVGSFFIIREPRLGVTSLRLPTEEQFTKKTISRSFLQSTEILLCWVDAEMKSTLKVEKNSCGGVARIGHNVQICTTKPFLPLAVPVLLWTSELTSPTQSPHPSPPLPGPLSSCFTYWADTDDVTPATCTLERHHPSTRLLQMPVFCREVPPYQIVPGTNVPPPPGPYQKKWGVIPARAHQSDIISAPDPCTPDCSCAAFSVQIAKKKF